nr:MAG TPA: Protein of unknown function (DUF2570) [Crassvirales sp.]
MKLNLYLGGITLLIILSLLGYLSFLTHQNKKLERANSIAMANIKAYDLENSNLRDKTLAFQLKVSQLNTYNDSILKKLNKVRKDLKIKDKDLKYLQYLQSKATRTDTIRFRDTIFNSRVTHIDTTLHDKWYQLNMVLDYPNTITVTPSFISEKYVIVHTKRETINPPKKCWIFRIFQKKHTVLRVEVIESNPYILNKQQKFIEIIK